jgi:hypothetical protein
MALARSFLSKYDDFKFFFPQKYGEFRTFFIPKKFFVGFALPLIFVTIFLYYFYFF